MPARRQVPGHSRNLLTQPMPEQHIKRNRVLNPRERTMIIVFANQASKPLLNARARRLMSSKKFFWVKFSKLARSIQQVFETNLLICGFVPKPEVGFLSKLTEPNIVPPGDPPQFTSFYDRVAVINIDRFSHNFLRFTGYRSRWGGLVDPIVNRHPVLIKRAGWEAHW